MMKAAAQPMRSLRQRGFNIALADLELAREIGVEPLVHQGRAWFEGLVDIDDGGQRLEIQHDTFCRVFRFVAVGRDNDDNRLSDVTDLIDGKQGLKGNVEPVADLTLRKVKRPLGRASAKARDIGAA